MTTPTPMTDAVVAAIRKWEADPRLYAHTKPPKSIRDHAVDLEIALASQIEITNNERAQKERLTSDLAAAKKALAARNKQLGVACMKHDLVHALACGYCLKEAQKALKAAEALAESLKPDAERYRYLRSRDKDEVFNNDGVKAGVWIDCTAEDGTLQLITFDDADEAIDAAIGAPK